MLDSLVQAPTPQEIEDEQYNDELQQSGYGSTGANSVTGY